MRIIINGREYLAPAGATVAAALLSAGVSAFRTSVSGEPRGPVCGMGACFECRVTIDGASNRRSCETLVRPDMRIETTYA